MSLCAAFFSQDMDLEFLRERLRRREEARQRALKEKAAIRETPSETAPRLEPKRG